MQTLALCGKQWLYDATKWVRGTRALWLPRQEVAYRSKPYVTLSAVTFRVSSMKLEPPHWSTLNADSSREEVLAAVAESERVLAEASRVFDEVEFPDVPEGFTGCVMSKCGRVRAHYGPIHESPTLTRQRTAGEEDQTVPGWDQGA